MFLIVAALLSAPVAVRQEVPDDDQAQRSWRVPPVPPPPRAILSIEGQLIAQTCQRRRTAAPSCATYVTAVADQLLLDDRICPVGGGLDTKSLVDAVRSYLKRRPAMAESHGSALVRAALLERFPCRH